MNFLKQVAHDLQGRFAGDFSHVTIVFPNRRAGLFFDEYLLGDPESNADTPIWSPRYLTIQELFDRYSPLKPVDDIKAICTLYQIYSRHLSEIQKEIPAASSTPISLDYFYGWGTQLLKDFSDIDRCRVPAREIFRNWSAAKELEGLTDEQKKILKPLLDLFRQHSHLKEEFSLLWSHLYDIYSDLNQTLAKDNEAYEGARQKLAVEKLSEFQKEPSSREIYVFVGFYMLVPVEWQLLDYFRSQGQALFYWDIHQDYTAPSSPLVHSNTMKRNLEHFPNALAMPETSDNSPVIEFVSTVSNTAQAYYATEWLRQHLTHEDERRTAIVLCDENLLQPLLYQLPSSGPDAIHHVNITKGFPMTHTPAFHYLYRLIDKIPAELDGAELLSQLAQQLQERAQREITQTAQENWLQQLTAESYFQCYTCLQRLHRFAEQGLLPVKRQTLLHLLLQIVSAINVPFHGEPAEGLQIMGMLETRNIDFESLFILSANEGILPRKSDDRSFIPFDLRKHYQIMTGQEQNEVYAYNFFRLFHHARHITILYNQTTDGERRKGEMSRYMLQLLTQTSLPIDHYSLSEDKSLIETAVAIPTADDIQQINLQRQKKRLSPSTINNYIHCPFSYFLKDLLNIPDSQPDTMFLPLNIFGSICHKAAEIIYSSLRSEPDLGRRLSALASDDIQLRKTISQAFHDVNEEGAKRDPQTPQYQAEDYQVQVDVMLIYLKRILKYDLSLAKTETLQIKDLEKKLSIDLGDDVALVGVIDRIDTLASRTRIIDYKTGSPPTNYSQKDKTNSSQKEHKDPALEELFSSENHKYILQTLLYEYLYYRNEGKLSSSYLYFMQKLGMKDFDPSVGEEHDQSKLEEFHEKLLEFIHTMHSAPIVRNENHCENCSFKNFCH